MEEGIDGGYEEGKTFDLAERDTQTGNYLRNIIETYHPSTFGIHPVQHLFPDN